MKVKELIDILEQCNPNMDVVIGNGYPNYYEEIENITMKRDGTLVILNRGSVNIS